MRKTYRRPVTSIRKTAQEFEINQAFNDTVRTFMDEGWTICFDVQIHEIYNSDFKRVFDMDTNDEYVFTTTGGVEPICLERDGEFVVIYIVHGSYEDWSENRTRERENDEKFYAIVVFPVTNFDTTNRSRVNIMDVDVDNATIIQQFNVPWTYKWDTDWRNASRKRKAMKKQAQETRASIIKHWIEVAYASSPYLPQLQNGEIMGGYNAPFGISFPELNITIYFDNDGGGVINHCAYISHVLADNGIYITEEGWEYEVDDFMIWDRSKFAKRIPRASKRAMKKMAQEWMGAAVDALRDIKECVTYDNLNFVGSYEIFDTVWFYWELEGDSGSSEFINACKYVGKELERCGIECDSQEDIEYFCKTFDYPAFDDFYE